MSETDSGWHGGWNAALEAVRNGRIDPTIDCQAVQQKDRTDSAFENHLVSILDPGDFETNVQKSKRAKSWNAALDAVHDRWDGDDLIRILDELRVK